MLGLSVVRREGAGRLAKELGLDVMIGIRDSRRQCLVQLVLTTAFNTFHYELRSQFMVGYCFPFPED
ncbi:unnamed protein product [Sphenostylis stenocarpa]|uniref:Uncharacterized protein n=1 Tax=Sphenostylis stenocarpa TaxID=92480 RepID=A0AA86SU94_9FABA|nr:unnamed protein product [Sphenostylis stenocarpa]